MTFVSWDGVGTEQNRSELDIELSRWGDFRHENAGSAMVTFNGRPWPPAMMWSIPSQAEATKSGSGVSAVGFHICNGAMER